MGLGEGADYDIIGDRWMVLSAAPDDVVGELEGGHKCKCKCKCAKAVKVYDGDFAGAWAQINAGRDSLIVAMAAAVGGNVASGDYSTAASSGDSSTAASSGDYSKAASSGNSSTAASSGDSSTAASSGDSSTAASSGDYSKAASSGNSSTAACDTNGFACVAGVGGRVRGNAGSALSLGYKDRNGRLRIATGYVGESGIEAGVWYAANELGEMVKAE
jgi:hypothetical protein